jgi:undecaprenyl diphosphate synthase
VSALPGVASLHVAIIMDGNGRWAIARGCSRSAGHRAGADAVRRAVEAAYRLGVGTLTLYAFSSDNWQRPAREVATLLALFERYLANEAAECARRGIRLSVLGRRDRLPASLVRAIESAESSTARGGGLALRLAVDYSSRDAILDAASRLSGLSGTGSREAFAKLLAVPDVDLLIRTGGERRLSDFLLWESAYAELVFLDRMWPDFDASDLEAALREFHARERRFGRIEAPAAATARLPS